ncbi:Nuclear pore protein NUP37 [Cladobotryum mycophilum]|uniref:Nuclear pore protein NUP37 n=1 Tax=Cladobotryum mycophilum TaxID=491253 RepID=A0ABR0SU17_9HYPO
MGLPMIPRIRRTAQNTQFTYNLSRRVNDVQTYPVQSPQGATILIYGHENGVTVVWRGGRRFKAAKKQPPAPPKEQRNGATDDAVMIIDSDDEEPPAKSQAAPKFSLDLALGAAVLHVAVMPLVPCPASEAGSEGAPILSEKIVFAVSCVTNDVYLITLPLTPPSPESKARPDLRMDLFAGKAGSGAWGETLVLLGGQRKYSEGLAISLVLPKPSEPSSRPARVVIASHSRQASGVLHLWDVPLDNVASGRPIEPFQTEFLPVALTSISFNPTNTTQLLAVSSPHAVRIYDFALSSSTSDQDITGPFPAQGSWLLSLYQPFARPSTSRKPILDAVWISHGRAVFALLADGMWGIWDIDGARPLQSTAAMSNKLKSGVQGAALTAFSVSGYVEGTSSLRSVATQQKENHAGEFAPMTPHTRRQATASLSSAATFDRLAMALQDESLVLWVGGLEHVCVIPGVSRFWDSQLRKGSGGGVNLFSGAQPTRMVKLLDLSTGLLGERCCGVGLVADSSRNGESIVDDGGLPVDILIRGESRLVIVREGEDGPGKKIGDVVTSRRNRLFSRGDKSDAIIVHGKQEKSTGLSFNLSTVKPGTLRMKPIGDFNDATDRADDSLFMPSRPRVGFDFTSTLSAAADASVDSTGRDVEAEMLDIMEIDHALDSMEDNRGSGRKKVLFEED